MYILSMYTISNPLFLKILPWVLEVFFSRTAGCFGVGRRATDLRPKAEVTSGEAAKKKTFRARHYKDLTEAGNCALKVSDTQGIKIHC